MKQKYFTKNNKSRNIQRKPIICNQAGGTKPH